MVRGVSSIFAAVAALFALVVLVPGAFAQEVQGEKPFTTEQLDQMLAPIALYPDDLLANVLMASTYPLEVVQSARWRKEPTNSKLKDNELTKALEAKEWDPSVKALVLVPDVLDTMSEKLDWTQKLGDAFIAQEEDVFARIQFLRGKAYQAGSLKSNEQQKVVKETEYIVIQPSSPDVIYVPVYQPTVVYGTWWYPNYPPYYWYWGHPGSAFVNGFFWGLGHTIGHSIWGWGHCDWHRNNINIDIDRYNSINVNKPKITSNKWTHDPIHRGAVPYRDKVSREKFAKTDKQKDRLEDFRGFDKAAGADKVKDKLGEGGADKIKDKLGEGGTDKIKDKMSDGAGSKVKDRVGQDVSAKTRDVKTKDKVASTTAKNVPSKVSTKQVQKPTKPASKALDVRPKAEVKRHVDRGSTSRKSVAAHRGGGGGGAKHGGGRRR